MTLAAYLRAVISPDWAADFYRRLFARRPDARALFHGSPEAQADKFAATLLVLIQESDGSLDSELYNLGQRHLSYQVTDSLYEAALESLLETLRVAHPQDWRDEWDTEVTEIYRKTVSRMHGERIG